MLLVLLVCSKDTILDEKDKEWKEGGLVGIDRD
jgi:hypothetical protein